MGTPYFDVTDANDLELLPPSMRGKKDSLSYLAASVEEDVVNVFTIEVETASYLCRGAFPSSAGGQFFWNSRHIYTAIDAGGRRGVFLDGYAIDAAAVTDAGFLRAMKRTIAEVIVWRARQDATDARTVQSQSGLGGPGSGTAVNYRVDAGELFPSGWERWLSKYDTRPVTYGL